MARRGDVRPYIDDRTVKEHRRARTHAKQTAPLLEEAFKRRSQLIRYPSRAYSAKGARPSTGPEKRSAPRAGPRLGGLSRPPRAAASAESEGPSSPLTRRERACVGVGRCLIAPACAPYSFWWGGRRQASLPLPPGRSSDLHLCQAR